MTITQLKEYCEELEKLKLGHLPAKFRDTEGREKDIDYAVKSSCDECMVFDEEWY